MFGWLKVSEKNKNLYYNEKKTQSWHEEDVTRRRGGKNASDQNLCVYMRKNGLRHGKDKEIKIYTIS